MVIINWWNWLFGDFYYIYIEYFFFCKNLLFLSLVIMWGTKDSSQELLVDRFLLYLKFLVFKLLISFRFFLLFAVFFYLLIFYFVRVIVGMALIMLCGINLIACDVIYSIIFLIIFFLIELVLTFGQVIRLCMNSAVNWIILYYFYMKNSYKFSMITDFLKIFKCIDFFF